MKRGRIITGAAFLGVAGSVAVLVNSCSTTRDGTKSTTQWGPVSNGAQTRNIYPAFKYISEHVHILKFDLDYEADDARITDSFRGEWYDLATRRQNDSFYAIGAPETALTKANETQTCFQGANTVRLERKFMDWLYHYDEPSSSGFNNFNAHAVFATVSFWFPQRHLPGRGVGESVQARRAG